MTSGQEVEAKSGRVFCDVLRSRNYIYHVIMGELMNYFLKFTILKVSNKADWQEKLSFVIFGFLKYMSVPDTTMGVFLKC